MSSVNWSTVSLILAFTAFIAIVIFVAWVPAARWRKDANIPLDSPPRADEKEGKSHE